MILHDIGKAAVPDAILSKPGPLDEDEWALMRRHTVIGERIMQAAPALAARVIAVCDAYDAMVSDRPYRAALSHEQALAELRSCAGAQFDPAVVRAFVAVVEVRAVLSAA